MLLAYVVRLVPDALAHGRFAGTVEAVATGRSTSFGSVDELLVAMMPQPRAAAPAPIDVDAGRAVRSLDPPD